MEVNVGSVDCFYDFSSDASFAPAHAVSSMQVGGLGVRLADTELAASLVDLVNSAGKANRRAVGTGTGMVFLSNDRRGNIGRLFENGHDRFWLLVNPCDADEALLVPGLGTKADWIRLRTDVADHPLAHHFELVPGDKFMVRRPAVVGRNPAGEWNVIRKGSVQGTV